jgi:hypothetical protein
MNTTCFTALSLLDKEEGFSPTEEEEFAMVKSFVSAENN